MHQSLRQTVNNKYQTWGKIFYALYITINILCVSGEYMFLGEQNKPDVLQEKLSQWYLTETIDHCLWDVSVKINQSKQITWHHDTHILWVLCKEYSNIISLSILGSVSATVSSFIEDTVNTAIIKLSLLTYTQVLRLTFSYTLKH